MVEPDEHSTLYDRMLTLLEPLPIKRVMVFGSQAWGEPQPDSDVDLLVVLDEETMPTSSAERGRLHQRVARRLRSVAREVPLDLVVYTRPMYQRFLERDSMFAREIQSNSKVLYEKPD
jgi:predicted nucleotidyltransferase